MDFQNAGFWRLKAPKTCIWAPEGAFGPKKATFAYLLSFFPYIWPLAGPNIAKKIGAVAKTGGAASTTTRGDRQTHFDTFFVGNAQFWRLKAPNMHISNV